MMRAHDSTENHGQSNPAPVATFASVDIRSELASRVARRRNHEAEDRALSLLAKEMAENPRGMLQRLVEMALDLCNAGTAGISLLEVHDGKELFRWEALAGVFEAQRDNTMPRNASPCGLTIDQNATQLMYMAERCFPALIAEPKFVEALLIPFHAYGKPIGTVWVVSHTSERKFDREDERLIRALAEFASAGWQLWKAYEAADNAHRAKDDFLAQVSRSLRNPLSAILGSARALRSRQLSVERVPQMVELIERNARQQLKLVDDLLNMTRTDGSQARIPRGAVEEDERRRIARDLHDHLGQQLTMLILQLGVVKEGCADQPQLSELLTSLEADAKRMDFDLDVLIRELRPDGLDDMGLTAALSKHSLTWSRHFGTPVGLHAIGMETERLTAEVETVLYRITQEALNNIAKHAHAGNVDILIDRRGDEVSLIIEDDGVGFDTQKLTAADHTGLGLTGIRERAALLGGIAIIQSCLGKGVTIFVRIPVAGRKHKSD